MTTETPTAGLIRVTASAKRAVNKEASERGMDQKIVASRVLEWFGSQDKAVRSLILDHAQPSELPELRRMLLRAL
jgi:hypothetical protein